MDRRPSELPPSAVAAFDAICASVLDSTEAVTDDMMEAYRTQIPGHVAIADRAFMEDIRLSSRRIVVAGVRSFRENRDLNEAELEALRELGRRRAEDGYPLPAVLERFQVGMAVVWEWLRAEVEHVPEHRNEILDRATRDVMRIGHRMSAVVSEEYTRTEARLAAATARSRVDLLHALLRGGAVDESALAPRLRTAGLSLERWTTVVVGRAAPHGADEAAELGAAQRVAAEVLTTLGVTAWPVDEPDQLAIIVTAPVGVVTVAKGVAAALAEALGERWCFGIGVQQSRPQAIAVAHRQAVQIVDVLLRLTAGPRVLDWLEGLPYRVLGTDPEFAQAVISAILGPILDLGPRASTPLIEAIDAFCAANCRLSDAAVILGMHRHSLENRLRRAEEVLHRDLRSSEDRFLVEVAIRAMRLAEPRPPGGAPSA